jgi:hypothetical protein
MGVGLGAWAVVAVEGNDGRQWVDSGPSPQPSPTARLRRERSLSADRETAPQWRPSPIRQAGLRGSSITIAATSGLSPRHVGPLPRHRRLGGDCKDLAASGEPECRSFRAALPWPSVTFPRIAPPPSEREPRPDRRKTLRGRAGSADCLVRPLDRLVRAIEVG